MLKPAITPLVSVAVTAAALGSAAWAGPASAPIPTTGPSVPAGEPPTYIVEFLPNPDPFTNPMRPRGINEAGDVTGNFDYPYRPFVSSSEGGTVLLPSLPGQSFGFGEEINDLDQVAGSSGFDSMEDPEHAVRWTGETPQDLGTLGGGDSGAYSLNNLGNVVGWSEVDPRTSETHPFLYSDETGMIDVAPNSSNGRAHDLNENDVVTGNADITAFRWRDGVLEDLGAPPGFIFSYGLAINENDQVAGAVDDPAHDDQRFAIYTDGVGWETFGGPRNSALFWGINHHGDAVGTGTSGGFRLGFVYIDGTGLFLLETLLAADEWTILSAWDINNRGQIAAYASSLGGRPRAGAVLLTPVSEACTVIGTAGDDVLSGTSGEDVMCGLDGNDTLIGGRADDTLFGGNGDDSLKGNGGLDNLLGETGNDTLISRDRVSGNDSVDGGAGTDVCRVDPGDSKLDCP